MRNQKINVLGTEYQIVFVKKFPKYLKEFEETADALFNAHDKTIFVKKDKSIDITDKGKERLEKKNLRHEIVHAFLFESGLSSNTYGHMGAWAEHEEMVDWFAIQSPKILKVFIELGILQGG